jgi:SET domain-containing protein
MKPQNWPKDFKYSRTSVIRGIHPNLFTHLLTSSNPKHFNKISSCIEERRVHPHLKIKKLVPPHPLAKDNSRVQRGLFASKKIPKNTELGEYVGEMGIDLAEVILSRPRQAYTWHVLVNGIYINICSANIANEITFVNDFRGIQDKPNVKNHLLIHRGIYYFGYVTIREIQPNEELLIDYGKFWEFLLTNNRL